MKIVVYCYIYSFSCIILTWYFLTRKILIIWFEASSTSRYIVRPRTYYRLIIKYNNS